MQATHYSIKPVKATDNLFLYLNITKGMFKEILGHQKYNKGTDFYPK